MPILSLTVLRLVVIILSAGLLVPTHIPTVLTNESTSWEVVFHDEFDGAELDTTKWDTVPRWGRVDPKENELQYYADDAFELVNGILRIKAEKRSMGGRKYTSGLIESSYKFTQAYGKFEIRAKAPKGQGFWSGFWLVPEQTWPPEIDVFEYLGRQPDTIYMSQHWNDASGIHKHITRAYADADFSQKFHIYTVIWKPTEITWYIDGVERFKSEKNIPTEQMFITTNLAVGGKWPENPDSSTSFPSYLDIDYIRVYNQVYQILSPICTRDG
jgi:beta-glucanase (GH16 family)